MYGLQQTFQVVVRRLGLPPHPKKGKNNKYLQKASSLGHLFRPIAVEVFGQWGETAEETLKEVSMLAPPVLGVSCQKFRRDWSVQLSLCLQKENAEIVNNKTLSVVGKKINKSRVGVPTARYFGFDCDD